MSSEKTAARLSFTFGGGRRRQRSRSIPIPNFATLLRREDYATLSNLLRDPNTDLSSWFDGEHSVTGENCLHILVKADPPVAVLQLMLKRLVAYGIPEPELSVDDIGRTALHQAVGCSCNPAVIEVLVSSPAGRMSTRAQDIEGRLPLHVAIRPYILYSTGNGHKVWQRRLGEFVDVLTIQKIMKQSVCLLLEAWPESVLVQDDRNRTAVDYAETLSLNQRCGSCAFQIVEALRVAETTHRNKRHHHQ